MTINKLRCNNITCRVKELFMFKGNYCLCLKERKLTNFWQNDMAIFLDMASKCSAIIQNNTLIENNVVLDVYCLNMMSAIQLNDVAFTETISRGSWWVWNEAVAQSSKLMRILKSMWEWQLIILIWWVLSSWMMWHSPEAISGESSW